MSKPIQRLDATGQPVGGMTATCTPTDSARGRLGLTSTFQPREKREGEALPRVINTQAKGENKYRPAQHLNARYGLAICG